MKDQKYSAGLISQSFWFVETKMIIRLVCEGKPELEIKRLCMDENLFGAAKDYRANRMYGYIWNRVNYLDEKLVQLFRESDLSTQKLITLIAILRSDRLFFEFVYEVYREKILLGVPVLEDRDVNIFFGNKELQDDIISKWTDATKKRLRSCYFNFLADANLITSTKKAKRITPPILDASVERYLNMIGDSAIVKAITGVN